MFGGRLLALLLGYVCQIGMWLSYLDLYAGRPMAWLLGHICWQAVAWLLGHVYWQACCLAAYKQFVILMYDRTS